MRWLIGLLAVGCVSPEALRQDLAHTEETLKGAYKNYGVMCSPALMAEAQANLDFTRIELDQGSHRRASDHLALAKKAADAAAAIAGPCGGVDSDEDTVADIVDLCIGEKEDLDGVLDHDGCRDIDPWADDDGDGIINQDDGCIDVPEDVDGDRDEDGCPETSEDSDGDGLINVVDKCPNESEDLDGFEDEDGCPDLDDDNDGIPDVSDKCPRVPEDLDDWDDEDGCPEPDNDNDGIPDLRDECRNEPGTRERNGCPELDKDKDGVADEHDQCPDEPETMNAYLDEDGCPDTKPTGVKVTRTRVEIDEILPFETGSARLLPGSNGLLKRIVQVLNDAPEMALRIEGHTDSDGSELSNLKLSKARAQSVMAALVKFGVSASRLSAEGYGETRPVDTNRTASGRANNRRVEFHIEKKD